jgi:hypothetical protein
MRTRSFIMTANAQTPVTAFAGPRQIASGPLSEALPAIKAAADAREPVLVFNDSTARIVELDLRGNLNDALGRLPTSEVRGPGRPKLGVVAREVTLLPRHWDWLATQPGGASVALRKLVEAAARSPAEERRLAQEVAYRFMMAMGGNLSGLDEANRALFAGDRRKFEQETESWPPDIRDYALRQAASALS